MPPPSPEHKTKIAELEAEEMRKEIKDLKKIARRQKEEITVKRKKIKSLQSTITHRDRKIKELEDKLAEAKQEGG